MNQNFHLCVAFIVFIISPKNVIQVQGDISMDSIKLFPSIGLKNLTSLVYSKPPVEAFMSTVELIQRQGYPVETHKVKTKDGYILSVFRIRSDTSSKKPVLIQHGFVSSSNDWLLLIPVKDNLPYLLADKGMDVWLGNFRGNHYSQGHVSLSAKRVKYWDFSFHEMGKYDIPAMIDYILKVTKVSTLYYIGHSLGTTAFFVAVDQNPDLNEKVAKMVALGPAAYGAHSKTMLKNFVIVPPKFLQAIFDMMTKGRLLPKFANKVLNKVSPHLCYGYIMAKLCMLLISVHTGFDMDQTNRETASLMLGHMPAPASAKTLAHLLQMVRNPNGFRHFDYGQKTNLERYMSPSPPLYNLSNVKVPIKALYGLNDLINDPQDAQRTIKELGNVVEAGPVSLPKFNHIDFLYAKNAKSLVYDQCIEFLNLPP